MWREMAEPVERNMLLPVSLLEVVILVSVSSDNVQYYQRPNVLATSLTLMSNRGSCSHHSKGSKLGVSLGVWILELAHFVFIFLPSSFFSPFSFYSSIFNTISALHLFLSVGFRGLGTDYCLEHMSSVFTLPICSLFSKEVQNTEL